MNPTKIIAIVLLVSLMLHTGLQVNRAHLRAVLRDYGLLGRAFMANFVLVPIYGVLLARLFHLSPPVATGLLLMAISPGVPFVVLSAGRRKGGSLGLAVALAFLLPALSIVTVPITASLVLPGSRISAVSIVVSLVLFQLLPLLIGMVVGERAPEAAPRLARGLGVIVLAAIVAIFVFLGHPLVTSITSIYGSLGMLAMLSIVVLSMLTGWVLGGKQREYRRTLGIGTGLRNIGLGAVVATTTFRGGEVAAAVLTYFLIQLVVATLVGVFFTRSAKGLETAA